MHPGSDDVDHALIKAAPGAAARFQLSENALALRAFLASVALLAIAIFITNAGPWSQGKVLSMMSFWTLLLCSLNGCIMGTVLSLAKRLAPLTVTDLNIHVWWQPGPLGRRFAPPSGGRLYPDCPHHPEIHRRYGFLYRPAAGPKRARPSCQP